MSDPILTPEDLVSPTWLKIKPWLDARVDRHRRKNDRDLDLIETAKLRGRIAEANEFLRLGQSPGQEREDE